MGCSSTTSVNDSRATLKSIDYVLLKIKSAARFSRANFCSSGGSSHKKVTMTVRFNYRRTFCMDLRGEFSSI